MSKHSGRNGGTLQTGTPGNKGGTGNPKFYKMRLVALLDGAAHQRAFEQVITDPAHPKFMDATKHAAEYGYGKVAPEPPAPTEPMSHEALLARLGSEVVRRNLDALNPPKALPKGDADA